MRNKILELIYKRLENPTTTNIFSKIDNKHWENPPFKIFEDDKGLSFKLIFDDGQPDINVYTKWNNVLTFFKWSPFGPEYTTFVECNPLVFELTPLEAKALTASVEEHHAKHLALVYEVNYELMSTKVENRLESIKNEQKV